jgi:hypothetical protein
VKTNDDDRIDFSPLDPTRDEMRFERLVRTMASQAAARYRHLTTWTFVIRWWRTALILAATSTLFAWVPSLIATSRIDAGAIAMADPVEVVVQWVHDGDVPSADKVLDSLRRMP